MRYGDKRTAHIKMVCPAPRPLPRKQEEAKQKPEPKQD